MIKCLRPTYAVVDLSAIRHNVESIKKSVGENVRVMPAVKADGYGHGAVEVSKACLSAGADILCVSSAEEGIELREAGIDSPILLLGASHYECIEEIIDYNFISTICEL
ncbi:MAG: alanine racemase, partial [Armatimonadota bacterium]